jgi:type IV pilus assembly protein PilX
MNYDTQPALHLQPKLISVQRGVALITALIFLIVLSLLGVSVVSSTSSEEKIARNARDYDIAFSAAEAAIRDAEMHIEGSWKWPSVFIDVLEFNDACTNGLCESRAPKTFAQAVDELDFFGAAAPGSNSVELGTVTGSPEIPDVANQPRYMIEMVCDATGHMNGQGCPKVVFRITAQGSGRLPNTRAVLQTVYRSHRQLF